MLRLISLILVCLFATRTCLAERPNILWLSAEDMSPHLGCYGDQHARTPNIDRLAAEGILYENAFSTAPVCAPSRSAIITGVYATSLGTHHMRSQVTLPPEIRCFPAYLREAGYYCTNNTKEDYNFRTPPGSWDESSRRAHWRNRPDDKPPFFAVFNYTGTHESHIRGDEPAYSRAIANLKPEELHDPATLELPPYYPDTPKVRAEWARYYNLITALDHWVAERLQELDDAGLAENTIVMFWSDHGVGMPRGKRWLYDSGIHVPLIVRVPERYQHLGSEATVGSPPPSGEGLREGAMKLSRGRRTDELVSLLDLAPTVLNLAGQAIPTYMQGRAFLGENLTPEREYIFAARDRMDERYDMSRVVRTKKYAYIRNFMPWRPYAQWLSYAEQSPTMQELRRLHVEGKLSPEQTLFLRETKPVEELYNLANDPDELNNLAEHRGYQKLLEINRKRLTEWMNSHFDLGPLAETTLQVPDGDQFLWYSRFRRAFAPEKYDDLRGNADYFSRELARMPHDVWLLGAIGSAAESDPLASLWWGRGETLLIAHGGFTTVLPKFEAVPAAKIAGAEFAIQFFADQRPQAVETLLQILENSPSSWDRLQAANVLDLLPDFEAHADTIRPVVERVHAKLIAKPAKAQTQAEGYILRVTEHLRERLEGGTP
ncbi:MAG: sulfatase [Pirellulales bacterium]